MCCPGQPPAALFLFPDRNLQLASSVPTGKFVCLLLVGPDQVLVAKPCLSSRVPPVFASSGICPLFYLKIQPRALHMLGRCATTKLPRYPIFLYFFLHLFPSPLFLLFSSVTLLAGDMLLQLSQGFCLLSTQSHFPGSQTPGHIPVLHCCPHDSARCYSGHAICPVHSSTLVNCALPIGAGGMTAKPFPL
jgi:hypothetical protein